MLIDLKFSLGNKSLSESNLLVLHDQASIVDFAVTSGDDFIAQVWQDAEGTVVTLRHRGWEGESARWRIPRRRKRSSGFVSPEENSTGRKWRLRYSISPSR